MAARIVLSALLCLTAIVLLSPAVTAWTYGSPKGCIEQLANPNALQFCQVQAVVKDLDGNPYGVEAGTPGYTFVCDPNTGVCTPGVPFCFQAAYYSGSEHSVADACAPLVPAVVQSVGQLLGT